MRMKSLLSRSSTQFAIVVLLSLALALFAGGLLQVDEENWYAFQSSIVHGFSALAGICLMAGFFFYERIEIQIENLRYACASAARKLKRGQLGLFDEGMMLGLLRDTKTKLDAIKELLKKTESEKQKAKLTEDWESLFSPYAWVYETLEEIAHAERKRSMVSNFTKYYFVPMFIPIILSIASICFADVLRSEPTAAAMMMYATMSIATLMILRLIYGSIWGGWNDLMKKDSDPSDFILKTLSMIEDAEESHISTPLSALIAAPATAE